MAGIAIAIPTTANLMVPKMSAVWGIGRNCCGVGPPEVEAQDGRGYQCSASSWRGVYRLVDSARARERMEGADELKQLLVGGLIDGKGEVALMQRDVYVLLVEPVRQLAAVGR